MNLDHEHISDLIDELRALDATLAGMSQSLDEHLKLRADFARRLEIAIHSDEFRLERGCD